MWCCEWIGLLVHGGLIIHCTEMELAANCFFRMLLAQYLHVQASLCWGDKELMGNVLFPSM